MTLHPTRALITGSKGFIGSHLSCKLRSLNIVVTEFDRGDVLNPKQKQDYVFHLAGEKNAQLAAKNPDQILQQDLNLANNILAHSKLCDAKCVIIISTIGVYGTAGTLAEEQPPNAISPYTRIKLAIEEAGREAHQNMQIPVVIARLTNVYGPGQSTEAVIASLITQMLKAPAQINMGNQQTIRDFIYIDDLCDALIKVAQQPKCVGETFNIGSGAGHTINEIAQMIQSETDYTGKIAIDPKKLRTDEIPVQIADISKIKSFTGWSPRIKLSEGIMKTTHYFQNEGRAQNARGTHE